MGHSPSVTTPSSATSHLVPPLPLEYFFTFPPWTLFLSSEFSCSSYNSPGLPRSLPEYIISSRLFHPPLISHFYLSLFVLPSHPATEHCTPSTVTFWPTTVSDTSSTQSRDSESKEYPLCQPFTPSLSVTTLRTPRRRSGSSVYYTGLQDRSTNRMSSGMITTKFNRVKHLTFCLDKY